MARQNIPVVMQSVTLVEFVNWVLKCSVSRSALILVCCDRQIFIEQLRQSAEASRRVKPCNSENPVHEIITVSADAPGREEVIEPTEETGKPHGASRSYSDPLADSLLLPTLQKIAASRKVKMVFVNSVPVLLAYLSTLDCETFVGQGSENESQRRRSSNRLEDLLVIVGLASLHKEAGDWSAQILGQSVGLAVEAAYRIDAGLVFAEFNYHRDDSKDHESEGQDGGEVSRQTAEVQGNRQEAMGEMTSATANGTDDFNISEVAEKELTNIWDEQIPILGASTKTFRANRLWMEKSVKVQDVFGRWCSLRKLRLDETT